jgi:hypothetical protein
MLLVNDCNLSTLAKPILAYGAMRALHRVLVGKRQLFDVRQLHLARKGKRSSSLFVEANDGLSGAKGVLNNGFHALDLHLRSFSSVRLV